MWRFRSGTSAAHSVGVKVDIKLDRAARAHDGIITLPDWIAAGNSRASWYQNKSGVLIRTGPGVKRLAGAATTPEQRIRAAVLASNHTIASHRSAARLWGVDIVGDDPVDLISTTRNRGPKLAGVVVHRPTDLDDLRPVARNGIPTTNAMRTLIDLGAVEPASVAPALEQLLIATSITVEGVTRTLFHHRRSGRAGVRALRIALEELPLGDKPPDSVLEPAMARLFERAGLSGWIFHDRVAGLELDFSFPAYRLDVEVDGWASHARREQFERDRERDAELGAIGWQVLRFTWRHVMRRPNWVMKSVAATLALRADFGTVR
jgi:very-short-patch-repair endonuclease